MYVPVEKKYKLNEIQYKISKDKEFKDFFDTLNIEEKVIFNRNITFLQYSYVFPIGIDKNPLVSITTNVTGEIVESNCHICQSDRDCHHLEKLVNEAQKKYSLIKDNEEWITERKKYISLKEEEEKARLLEEKNQMIRKGSLNKVSNLLEAMNHQDVQPLLNLVKITPSFVVLNGYNVTNYAMSLKIGIDKMYTITNISNFIDNVSNGNEYTYGKQLSFKHSINNFDKSSQGLINILINFTKGSNATTYKSINIDIELFEKIIILYKDQIIDIENLEKISNSNYYLRLNPSEVKIKLNSKYIFEIQLNDEAYLLDCPNNTFYIKNNIIDIITLTNDKLTPLFLFARKNPTFSYKHIKDILIKEILARFYKDIEIDSAIEEEVSVKDFNIEAYFDYLDDSIIVKSKYIYNNQVIDEEEIASYKSHDLKLNNYKLLLRSLGFIDEAITEASKVFLFLSTDLNALHEVATIFLSERIKRMQAKKYQPLKMNLSYNTGMLSICFEESKYSDEELTKIIRGLRKKTKYIKLKNNVILEVDEDNANKLLNTIDEFGLNISALTSPQNIPLYQAMKLNDKNLLFVDTVLSSQIEALLNDVATYKEANYQVPSALESQLRSYQKEAFLWMKTLMKHNLSGILADDMGLGKTIEMISVIASDDCLAPSLIVCPKSLCYNWKNEFELWVPHLKIVNIIGNGNERKSIITNIKNDEFVIYITSYDSLRIDLEFYQEKSFQFMILDEGQYIKNHDTLKAQSVKEVKSKYRFVLTGTPIENTIMDLWSIFDFLMPGYLGSLTNFRSQYERAIIERKDSEAINKLILKISPFILRRTKQDVIKDLPEKIELIQAAKMTDEQNKIYQAELKRTRDVMNSSENKIEILACITRLRQVCVDPGMYIDDYQGGSGKVSLVMELLDEYIANDHRIILFSQFTTIFKKISQELAQRNIKYYILTGKTPAENRVLMATDFNENNEYKVFLVSLKAGGTGLNLVGADVVIHLDPWWNVAAENQATDRAHRIGQTRVVQVIKLVCEDSIEQKVIELQEKKKEIVKMIVADDDTNIQKLSKDDLSYLISE